MAGRRGWTSAAWLRSRLLLGLCVMLCAVGTALAEGSKYYEINLPRQSVAAALNSLSEQTNVPVVFPYDLARDRNSNPVIGRYTLLEALDALLRGTGLSGGLSEKGVLTISQARSVTTQGETEVPHNSDESSRSRLPNSTRNLPRIAGLLASLVAAFGAAAQESSVDDHGKLSEIVVTAEKKSERLQDVPVPVTVLTADDLLNRNEIRLQDYFATVPGLSLATNGPGQQFLTIRGVASTSIGNPTVGVTIDDVPIGSSSQLAGGGLNPPDLDPSDLSHIEVLRGPQGTLYGASSIGGLLKFVTADPSTNEISGRAEAQGSGVATSQGGLGYAFRGAINVPLSDSFGVRASAFARQDPGYLDNVLTGRKDANAANVYGGFLSMLWRPSEFLSLKVTALIQDLNSDGNSLVDTDASLQPILGDLKQAQAPGNRGYDQKTRFTAATLHADLGAVELTSVTGYSYSRLDGYSDVTGAYGGAGYFSSFFPGVANVSYAICNCFTETEKVTEELRLSSASGQRLEWLAGAFYTHENSPSDESGTAVTSVGAPVGLIEDFKFPSTLSEYALFGNLTLHVTSQFDVQFGARESWNRQVYSEIDSGLATEAFYQTPSPLINPTERTNGSAFTYLVTPSFKISPDMMVYARVASGYRNGGPNFNAVHDGVPVTYAPDKTQNYELGFKGNLLKGALVFDASIYYLDWHDIQISLVDPVTRFSYIGNGGAAKSQGIELSLQLHPTEGLSITATGAFDNAGLRQNLPLASTAYGLSGDRLPYSSRFSGSLSGEQDVSLGSRWTGFVGASVSYVGARLGEFSYNSLPAPPAPRLNFPSYAQANMRIGAKYDSWTVGLFSNNIFDKRGILGGSPSSSEYPYYAVYIQPVTVGLNISRTF